jgi:hypothetical protein
MPSHGLVVAKNAWSPVKNFNSLARMIADAVIKTRTECTSSFRDFGFESESQCAAYVERRKATPSGPVESVTRANTP